MTTGGWGEVIFLTEHALWADKGSYVLPRFSPPSRFSLLLKVDHFDHIITFESSK